MGQDKVVDTVIDILQKLAATGPAARGKDLDLAWIEGPTVDCDPSPLVGIYRLPYVGERGGATLQNDDVVVLGVAFAYRQADSAALIAFADAAESLSAQDIRLAPDHGFFVTGLTLDNAQKLQQTAAALGFLTNPNDPRRSIALCAGSRGCASAFYDTKHLAAKLLTHASNLLDGSIDIHLSGCAKGCAHSAASPLNFVGARAGYGLVVNGAASGVPDTYIAENHIDTALARLQALLRQSKEGGETAEACLVRLGAATIAAALQLDGT